MISLLLPSTLSLGLALLLTFSSQVRQQADPFLHLLPLLVLGSGLFLAWRFNRSRLAYALVLLTVCGLLLHWPARLLTPPVAVWFPLLPPLGLMSLLLLPEKGFFTLAGLLRPILLAALAALVLVGPALAPDASARLLELSLVSDSLLPAGCPSQVILLITFLSFILASWLCWRRPGPLETGLLSSLLLCLPALYGPAPLRPETWFAFAGMAPTLAIVEMSLQMAFRDDLTGLPGRRALNESLQRLGSRYSIAMLDIDHFKKFNDKHGHDVGDQVLRMVAGKLARVKEGGRAYRYGGEEFAILFPGKPLSDCFSALEDIRKEIEAARFTTRRRYQRPKNKPKKPKPADRANQQLRVTISIGVAERQKNMRPEMVLKAADKALYRAKSAGRNRVSE